MFQVPKPKTRLQGAVRTLDLIYESIVRDVRKGSRHALLGLIQNIFQTVLLVITFYLLFTVLGLRGNAIRGDFVLFVMSGIFMYMCHIKSVACVVGTEGPTGPMMQHAPMNTWIAIISAALSTLYIQILSVFVILFLYHAVITPIEIYQPLNALWMVIMAWFSGCAAGTVFLALKPRMPDVLGILSTVYIRANMIASGKMFLANTLPAMMLNWFDWNPLFHIIDQCRGFTFVNYNPQFSSISYPIIVSLVLLMIGMIGESYTRKHVSASWTAGR